MQLTCENCGAEFDPAKISRRMRFAECAYCNTLHNIAEITARRAGRKYVPPATALPRGIELEERADGLRISFPAAKAHFVQLAGAAVLFAGVSALMATLNMDKFARTFPGGPMVPRVLLALAILAVVAVLYVIIANLINRESVLITATEVRSKAGPLPLRIGQTCPLNEIQNVIARGPKGDDAGGMEGYSVVMITTSYPPFKLMGGLPDPEIAEVLQHYIKQAMGLAGRVQAPEQGRTRVLFKRPDVAPEPSPSVRELACTSCGAPIPMVRIRKDLLAAECAQCGIIQDVRAFLRHGIVRRRRDPGFRPPWGVLVEPGQVRVWQATPRRDVVTFYLLVLVNPIVSISMAVALFVFAGPAGWLALVLGFGLAFSGLHTWPLIQGQWVAANANGVEAALTPFSSFRKRTLYRADIAQLVCVGTESGFAIRAILQDGTRTMLLDGLHDWAHALYLEQRFESLLKIDDAVVAHVAPPGAS